MICAGLAVKKWTNSLNGCPSTEALRPLRCESCHEGVGLPGALSIHGHGTVLRGLRIIVEQGFEDLVILVRRFRCLKCRHVMIVAPREVRAWFRYSVALIARILALWVMDGVSERELRTRYSGDDGYYSETFGRWPNLKRWVAKTGKLFGPKAPQETAGSAKVRARRFVNWLDGYSPPDSGEMLAVRVALAVRSASF